MKDDYVIVKRLKSGETLPAGNVPADLIRTAAGAIHISTADGPKELVHAANINTVLQAAGGAGWEKAQATTANYSIVRPTSGASLDLHIEVGGTLAALAVANWPIPASGVEQIRIRNMSAVAQTFSATGFSGIVTADGNVATSGSYSIPVDMAVHITIDEDGWVQVAPMGQEVSQSEFDAELAGKADATHNHTGTYEPANTNIQNHVTAAHAPSTAEQNVQSDWNAASGDAQILNKPAIPEVVAWTSYTPIVTSESGGWTNYTVTGRYRIIDKMLTVSFRVIFSNPSTAADGIYVSLPSGLTMNATVMTGGASWDTDHVGFGLLGDSGVISGVPAIITTRTNQKVLVKYYNAAATAYLTCPGLSNATPWTWTWQDTIDGQFTVPIV